MAPSTSLVTLSRQCGARTDLSRGSTDRISGTRGPRCARNLLRRSSQPRCGGSKRLLCRLFQLQGLAWGRGGHLVLVLSQFRNAYLPTVRRRQQFIALNQHEKRSIHLHLGRGVIHGLPESNNPLPGHSERQPAHHVAKAKPHIDPESVGACHGRCRLFKIHSFRQAPETTNRNVAPHPCHPRRHFAPDADP